jgi:ferrous iron transport protein B
MRNCPSCQPPSKSFDKNADLVVALAGNANVGKSAVFNQLTGVGQIIGNWPGKTVERAEGMLKYEGLKIKIIDLPESTLFLPTPWRSWSQESLSLWRNQT